MGLAASQARLLFITLRQNDVSANMQNISNKQMILARDEDVVYDKYKQILNGTTFQDARTGQDLNYNDLMGAAAYNAGELYMLTDAATNQVVLNPQYSQILGLTGIGSGKDFAAKYPSLESMSNVLVPELEKQSKAGLGGSTLPAWNADWSKQVEAFKATNGTYPSIKKQINAEDILKSMGNLDVAKTSFSNVAKGDTAVTLYSQGKNQGSGKESQVVNAAKANFENLANSIASGISKAIGMPNVAQDLSSYIKELSASVQNNAEGGSLVSGGYSEWKEKTKWYGNHKMFNQSNIVCNASDLTRRLLAKVTELYSDNSMLAGGVSNASNKAAGKVAAGSINYSSDFVYTFNEKGMSKQEYEKKLQREFTAANYDGANWNQALSIAKQGAITELNSNQKSMTAQESFIKTLYDQLKSSGWKVDEGVTSASTLKEKLANRTYLLNKAVATNSELVQEVADPNAEKKAEDYRDDKMRKIKREEDQLTVDLTKLQTEFSSLNTEYESVKSIINGNIQRSFTYGQS